MRLFLHQLRAEQLIFWRSREAAIFVFLFPILLFLLLTTVYSGEYRGEPIVNYLVAGLLGYGVANTALGGLAISLVFRREMALLKRVRSTPLPPATYLGATLVSQLLVFALQSTALVALAVFAFGAELPRDLLSLVLALALGAAAFAALGIAVAAVIRSQEGVSPLVNLIVLPMAFLTGAFGPTRDFPDFLKTLAEVLPLRPFVEIVTAIFLDEGTIWEHPVAVAVVAAWGLAGFAVAARRFGWEPRER